MKTLFFFLSIIVCTASVHTASAQKQTNVWYFGTRLGFDFNTATPTLLYNGAHAACEGTSSICDASGNLIFYTDGYTLYNSSHAAIGGPLTGGNTSTQGALAVPNPANTNQYYLFVADVDYDGGCSFGSGGLNYYVINNSAGTISRSGPTLLQAHGTFTEGIVSITDRANGYWIVTHEGGSIAGNQFWAYHVKSDGSVVTTPVKSSAGGLSFLGFQNTLKTNSCQDKIGAAYWDGTVEVYDFNNSTGTVSNRRSATGNNYAYGFEFSPDGNLAYFTTLAGSMKLYQWNFTGGTAPSAIGASGNVGYEMGNMQLGPDNKIYLSMSSAAGWSPQYIGVISNPNSTSTPGFSNTAISYTSSAGGGYPYTFRGMPTLYKPAPVLKIVPSSNVFCPGSPVGFSYTWTGNGYTVLPGSEVWNWGDGTANTTGSATPSHNFPGAGPYTVTLTVTDAQCGKPWSATTVMTYNCPAPVELVQFTAGSNVYGGADIEWVTARETDNAYFEIQRSSDGIHFSTIGTVKGTGYSQSMQRYQYQDQDLIRERIYYRLIQHDVNEKTMTSHIITVTGETIEVSALPNPFQDHITVSISHPENSSICIRDVVGRVVYSKTLSAEDHHLTISPGLMAGIYTLETICMGQIHQQKLVRE